MSQLNRSVILKKQKAKTEKGDRLFKFIVEGSRKEQVCFYSEIEYFKAEDSTE